MSKAVSLVILDRDGVINHDCDNYIKSVEEWRAIEGSIEAIRSLKKHKIPVAIATNQSGLARGYFSVQTLEKMHAKLLSLLQCDKDAIKHIAICSHLPAENCRCRKPKIGMLQEIAQKLSQPLDQSVYFVGDSFKDVQAARAAGCTPVLVKTGKGQRTLQRYQSQLVNVMIFDNLNNFVEWVAV